MCIVWESFVIKYKVEMALHVRFLCKYNFHSLNTRILVGVASFLDLQEKKMVLVLSLLSYTQAVWGGGVGGLGLGAAWYTL